ncbi:MAG: DUF302 domain-containing protein [Acidimicrobiales bacterium]|nr:DUF302 domain-containing protein [Acidimicrobiales bacterium]
MSYTRTIQIDGPVDDAVDKVKAALQEQGFGTLTEIDLAATMREKLDVEVEPYVILGACNPELAHRALEADRSIGALLPCNVVVRAQGDRTIVDALDPSIMSQLASGLEGVASDATERIDAALSALGSD